MKIKSSLFVLSILFLFIVTGCSKGIQNEEQKIIVQRYVVDKNIYEDFRNIIDNNDVKKAKDILNSSDWKNAKVDMSHSADYQFYFQFKNPNIEAKAVLFQVWISPNKDQIEIVKGNDQYSQLTKDQSSNLFEVITGIISDFKR